MTRKNRLFFSGFQFILRGQHWGQQHWFYGVLMLSTIFLLIFPSLAAQYPRLLTKTPPSLTQRDTSAQFVDQGQALYEAEQYPEAVIVLLKALRHYKAQGDRVRQAWVLSNLSLSYQQLGSWTEAKQTIQEALALLQNNPKRQTAQTDLRDLQMLAQAQDIQARLQLSLGQAQDALNTWLQAAQSYALAQDFKGEISSQINQAQALKALGNYHLAKQTLEQVQKTLAAQPDSVVKAVSMRSLGGIQLSMGHSTEAHEGLQKSLAILQTLKLKALNSEISSTLLSLGNVSRMQGKFPEALAFYQQAAEISPTSISSLQAQLNALSVLITTHHEPEAYTQWPKIQAQLTHFPTNRTTVFAGINLSESLLQLSQQNPEQQELLAVAQANLEVAARQSQQLGDRRAESYALGILGKLHEHKNQWQQAQDLTQTALTLAQVLNAPDITYRWQGQLGRLLNQQGKTTEAISAYSEAVNALQRLRKDLTTTNQDLQFSFRDQVEPIYRELVRLLLLPHHHPTPSQENLKKARDTIRALQVAEVENFLQVRCLDVNPVPLDIITDKTDPTAAILYPILLPDRIAVILKLPQDEHLGYYETRIESDLVQIVLDQFLQALSQPNRQDVLEAAQLVYQWILAKPRKAIDDSRTKTLVFVLDSAFQNIPMGALHDGQKYLIEGDRYNIAISSDLQLFEPHPFQHSQLKAFAAGLSTAVGDFSALPYVDRELEILKTLKIVRTPLLNQTFTQANFQTRFEQQPFSILHLATHGQFSSNPEETFIRAFDQKIKVNQLDTLLRSRDRSRPNPLELLVLSACQTLTGDRRASLGIAGVAIRAGARSTLATLWSVNDEATYIMMKTFYETLSNPKLKVTKAAALKQAQQALIKEPRFQNPHFWAPYVLVGNWL